MATSAHDHHLIRLRPKRAPARVASLTELVDALDVRASALHCGHDPRKVFAEEYARHAELVEAMRRAGVFGAAATWTERLMLEQAGHYFRALDAWDSGDLVLTAAPWRAVFSRSRYEGVPDGELSRLSNVVHTGYDLPLALARCPLGSIDAVDARRAFDRIPALVVGERQRSAVRVLPWRRRDVTSDIGLRQQAWDDGMSLLEASDGDELRSTFTRIETRVLLRVAG